MFPVLTTTIFLLNLSYITHTDIPLTLHSYDNWMRWKNNPAWEYRKEFIYSQERLQIVNISYPERPLFRIITVFNQVLRNAISLKLKFHFKSCIKHCKHTRLLSYDAWYGVKNSISWLYIHRENNVNKSMKSQIGILTQSIVDHLLLLVDQVFQQIQ